MLVRHPRAPLPAWSIVGGKLTTCRSLAETAAAEVLGVLRLPVRGTSRERSLPGACAGAGREAAVAAVAARLHGTGVADDAARRVAERTVALFGSRGPDAVAEQADIRLISGLSLPASAVGFCVQEEWAATLADVVERRLMISFDEGLSLAALEEVAAELVRCGVLPRERMAAEVAACATRLREHHGRELPPHAVAAAGQDRWREQR